MKRIIEPELMNETDQVEAYANADFSISDQEFVNYFLDHAPLDQMKQIADLGGDLIGNVVRDIVNVWWIYTNSTPGPRVRRWRLDALSTRLQQLSGN